MRAAVTHRLRRRGRPSDVVDVPRTSTEALKVTGARAAPAPLRPSHRTHPAGAAIFLFFLNLPCLESIFIV